MAVVSNRTGKTNVIHVAGIELYTGEAALTLLTKNSTLKDWATLYKVCPWATVFQSHAFVFNWYQTYQQTYLPIMVVSFKSGRLTGLLALAYDYRKKIIIGAGGSEAEYQSFLSEASHGESFIKAALFRVREQFPHISIRLGFLPSQVPLQWISDPYWRWRSVLQTCNCPLMEMSNIEVNNIVKKTGFRGKLNKLKRLGLVEFEHIKNINQFSKIFVELITLYDFRQGAKFNLNQFKNNPFKKDFYLALFQQNLLHVTILKVKGQIFAAVIAIGKQDLLHLSGMIVHAPFYAKYCSPGFLHLVLLTQQLAKEDISIFDLSPGGDFYKSRIATNQVKVYELVITDNIGYRVRRYLRKHVHNILFKTGNWPMRVKLAIKKRLYFLKAKLLQLKKQGLLQTITGKVDQFICPSKKVVYEVQPQKVLANNVVFPIKKDDLQDLLCYEDEDHRKSRWEFLEEAMQRFEVGQSAFTFCQEGLLLACIWLDSRAGSMPLGLAIGDKTNPSYMLQGFYCHSVGKQHWPEFVAAVVVRIGTSISFVPLHAQVSSKDQKLCQVLESIGFRKTYPLSTSWVS